MFVSFTALIDLVATHWVKALLTVIVCLIVAEQLSLRAKAKNLNGPAFVVPFVGSIIQMVYNPAKFWADQFNRGRISWNSIAGFYTVCAQDAMVTRDILSRSCADMPLILHPNAYTVLGKTNLAFMNGELHKELRARLLPLFSLQALSVYFEIQQKAIHEHLQKWYKLFQNAPKDGIAMKQLIWDLNCETSVSVFVGPHVTPEVRKSLQENYKRLTEAFLALPLNLPGTALAKGVEARKALIPMLTEIARKSKEAMRRGDKPQCLIDFWMEGLIKDIDAAQAKGLPMPPHSTDAEIGEITLDFLFASQDASTASLVWCIDSLCRFPDVARKVREEQLRVRPNGELMNLDIMMECKYTLQVMREILRQYPPATMVPHIAEKPTTIDNGRVHCPKGTLIIPSIYNATHQGYSNPWTFDPDRFSPERDEDAKFQKYWLVFGHGPHLCLGRRYAMNHLTLFLSILGRDVDMERKWSDLAGKIGVSPNPDEMMYAPTIYPRDECVLLSLKPRANA